MAQVSYGTITITDTNDIESITIEYAKNQSTSNPPDSQTGGWSTTRPAWQQGYYMWQRARIHKSGTDASADTFGAAVCLTGSTGQTGGTGAAGRSLTGTTTQYTTAASNVTITQSNMGSYTWSNNVPAYNSSTPAYWVRVTNTYSNPSSTEYIIYKDNGIADAVKTANDANTTANTANQTANSAKSKADTVEGNLNNYITSNNNALNALQTKTKYFWTNLVAHTNGSGGWTKPNYPVGTYAASGINGTTFDEENSSTYGYNTLYANGINLRYNAINLGQLTGSSLIFYNPSTTSQGTKAMELSGSALKFYASNGSTVQAEFGGSKARVSGTINAYDGQIGNSSNNYWYIGNYTDYFQNTSAVIKSHGTAFIQLGDLNTWRFATNRIHSAWNDDNSSGDAFRLHFPVYSSKYWDSGLHLPLSISDKFLYIRNAPNTQTLENLNVDLEDGGYNYWTYRFYITADGSLYARNLYVLDDDGNTTQIGGTDGVYLLKSGGTITGNLEVNGTLTKGSKSVAYLTATPTSGQILVADGTSGGIKTTGYTIAKSVPSTALFTDENVQTSQANTTKIWLTGTSTSATNTGKLNFDSNVYLTTTAGTLHATTFDGTSFTGTAAKATADGDGNTIKTTYLKLTGGQVTGPVSFGDSVSIDDLSAGQLVVTGSASFTNNLQVNTINGVAVGSSPKFTDNNTTYTFANGTNGFTVTPGGGTAQTVTVTPSITNNITGSGTSGYLVKFTGTNTIGNGPQIGTSTSTFLRNDGTWATPAGTGVTSVAASGSGGITISGSPITTSGTIAVGLDLSTAINGLSEDTSNATRNDYAVVQYAGGGTTTTTFHRRTLARVFAALNASDITTALGYTPYNSTNPNGYTTNTGTVTSVRVQASSPLQSSTSTAQSASLNTTISFVNQNKNLVLAGPSSGTTAAAPTFRSLVAADIPNLSWNKITSDKPTTLSGYGITDAAGSNAIVGLSATSNDAGVTTFTATRASGTNPLSFEVSIVASAATGANALKDSNGLINKGSATKPVYFSNGVPAEANTYAGGTAITLNNSSKASSTASFYAPTSGGTTAQVLAGNGATSAPVWKDISDLVPSSATNATYATYDASESSKTTKTAIADKYIPKSIGTAAGDIIYWSASGTPVRLAKGSNGQVLKLANGVPTWGTDNNTTYTAGTGLSLSGTVFNHSNSVTAATAGTSSATSSTNRTIAIPYVTYDAQGHITASGTHIHTIDRYPEAYLSWGGRNFSGSYGCIDAAMIDVLGANRFAFLKATGLTIEYSTDGGSNWIDYGATNNQKTGLFGAGQSFFLGKATAKENNTVNNQLRVTIDTSAASIYTVLNKIAIYMNTAGNTVQVLIEKALQSTPTTYSTHLNWTDISGWSGWNILNISELITYGNTAASQYGRVRFTFKQTAINSNYSSASISRIMGFGGVGWTVPSNMAKDGHLYSYDNSQNATFPAQVSATQFNGNATTATIASKISDLTSTDNASSTDTWRKVWISYNDGVTGRPAVTDSLIFQTSTKTLKTSHILAEHISGGQDEFRITYGSTVDMAMMVGTGDINHGLYDHKANKWMIYADGSGNVSVNGNAATATSASSATKATQDGSGNVITSTYLKKAGDTMSGQLNVPTLKVGKTTVATNTYADTNPKIIFGNSNDSQNGSLTWTDYDTVQAPASLTLNSHLDGVYFIAPNIKATSGFYGNLNGNATSATKATQDGNGNTITTKYVTVDTTQVLSSEGIKTYLGLQTYGSSGISLGVTASANSVTQKVNMKYDGTLDALVFSFPS